MKSSVNGDRQFELDALGCSQRMDGGGRPLLPEILHQLAPVGAKSPIFNRYSLVVLITNRKSHTVFRLVPTSVTLNDLERRIIALILLYFTEFDSLAGQLRHSD